MASIDTANSAPAAWISAGKENFRKGREERRQQKGDPMPWQASDAKRFDKAATGKRGRQWSAVANSALGRGASEKSAIMQASGVVKRQKGRAFGRGSTKR